MGDFGPFLNSIRAWAFESMGSTGLDSADALHFRTIPRRFEKRFRDRMFLCAQHVNQPWIIPRC